jgi:MATE family multidrug resistance protein
LIPGVYPFYLYEAGKRYLQCQGVMSGTLFVFVIGIPLNIFLQWFLVWGPLQLDIVGSAIALMVTYAVLPVLLVIFALLSARSSIKLQIVFLKF